MLATLTTYSHHFELTNISPILHSFLYEFSKRYNKWGLEKDPYTKKLRNVITKRFYVARNDLAEYRYHINELGRFWTEYENRNYSRGNIEVINKSGFKIKPIVLEMRDNWILREDQEPAFKYSIDKDNNSKIVGLQTGKGKGIISMKYAEHQGQRVVVVVLPKYISKWVIELKEKLKLETKDILTIQGGAELQAFVKRSIDGTLDYKVAVVSATTMQNWFREFESHTLSTAIDIVGCHPKDFFETVNAGVRIIDEVHASFHLNFILDLYTNVNDSLAMSATLLADDKLIERMQLIAYPLNKRLIDNDIKKYVICHPLEYKLKIPKRIRCTGYNNGMTTYNHTEFEKSILKYPQEKKGYLNMITESIDHLFIKNFKEGRKCIIFCATIAMGNYLRDEIKIRYPTMRVGRCMEGDSKDIIYTDNIIISTIGMMGTAIDIPNLITAINTVSIKSTQSNIQILGRLRSIDVDCPLIYAYFYCQNNAKQLEYHIAKTDLLKSRVKFFKTIYTGQLI